MVCWVGTEIENNLNYGNKTIFVKAKNVSLSKLIRVLNDNIDKNIKSIYFGAGSTDVNIIKGNQDQFDYIKTNYELILETTFDSNHNTFINARRLFEKEEYSPCIVSAYSELESIINSSKNHNKVFFEYKNLFDNIIVTLNLENYDIDINTLSFKTKQLNSVSVVNQVNSVSTNLDTLNKVGLFADVDELVYDSER